MLFLPTVLRLWSPATGAAVRDGTASMSLGMETDLSVPKKK